MFFILQSVGVALLARVLPRFAAARRDKGVKTT
jgi:hypothetical protein